MVKSAVILKVKRALSLTEEMGRTNCYVRYVLFTLIL